MTARLIILASVVFLSFWPTVLAQQVVPAPPSPAAPYATTASPQSSLPAAAPYISSSPVIQPAPQIAPVYPPPTTVVPLPSQTPGSVFGPPITTVPNALPIVTGPPNPIAVPVIDEDLAWDQIVDVVSDYFPISREQRARRCGDAATEGRIETAPQDGATWLEPHRQDSVGAFNRWESTFQSIRRHAVIRVIPDAAGYLVEVVVEKELEDLPAPEKARVGPASDFHNESSLPSRRREQLARTHSSRKWLPLGHDPALEQRMLADIHARLTGITAGRSVFAP